MSKSAEFNCEVENNINQLGKDEKLKQLTLSWIQNANIYKYTYNFSCMGRPIIQYPQDIIAMQEIIWQVKPDLIIETGIAHGGSLIMSASMLALLDYCEAVEAGKILDPHATHRRVLGIDIDIRSHNRAAIETHPMAHRIKMIQGSSITPEVIAQVQKISKDYKKVIVCLDSNHTYDHVLAELEAYAPLVSKGSYCVVFDTIIEDMPDDMFPDRPWGKGNNPYTAVQTFLKNNDEFEVDERYEKLMISTAPSGYLKRVK